MDPETPKTPETPETPEPSLLDSVSAALAPTLPEQSETAADESQTTETDDADGDEVHPEGDGEDEAEEAGEGTQERNPDGTFKSRKDAPDASKKAGEGAEGAGKLGPDGKPLVEPKKADPVNDPIPDDIKGRTRERMSALIDTVKQKQEVLDQQHIVIKAVQDTGATPEEFSAMISYMGWVHSDDPKNLRLARDMLLAELEGVAVKLGESTPGIDFIGKHPDIKEALETGRITPEAAQELAIARTRNAAEAARTTAAREQDATTQRATMERNNAIAELDKLGKDLQASDPEYVAKHKILEPVLASLGMLPPKQWKPAFLAAYKAVKLPAAGTPAAPAAPANGGGNRPQPLRANKNPSGGDPNRKPTSLLDAVSAAVDSVGQ